jgi:hypothetical protein
VDFVTFRDGNLTFEWSARPAQNIRAGSARTAHQ